MSVTVVNHPIIKERLTNIRKTETPNKEFADGIKIISEVLFVEATKNISTKEIEIKTPICKTKKEVISDNIVVVPILRAGLGMVDAIRELIPNTRVGIIGLQRDEKTLKPIEYYAKFPKGIEEARLFIVDPMLATGGSACDAINQIKARGAKNITLLSIVAAPEGIKRVTEEHPDVNIFTAALDDHLNELGYIVPGLGDCGDRLFGTDL